MTAGWETKPIGDVCTIKPPKSEAKARLADDEEVSFAPMEDLGIGQKYLQPRRTRHLGEVSGSYTYFADGDVLLAKITPCFENGKLGVARDLTNGVGFGSSEYIVFRPASALDAEFLYYYLARPTFLEEGARTMTGAVGHKRVTKEFVERYPIPVPPVAEQRRIVAILDEAFEGIATAKANAEKNLQNARRVFTNHLERVFERRCDLWQETTLGEIAEIKGGKRVPKGYKLLDEDTGYPYLRVTDFGARGSIEMSDLKYVSPAVHAEIKKYIITPRDLYISIAGTIGRTGIVPDELDGANLTENACRLVFNSGVSNRFVYYYTKTPAFIEQAGFNTRTAAQPKLALSRLATIRLPMPKLEVQAAVVTILDSIAEGVEALEGIYQKKAIALDELKKSLLHQAFAGAL